MGRARRPAIAAALCALAIAGCGLGAGDRVGDAELTVTSDYGSELLVRETVEIGESDTVLRLLDREAEVETAYGGGFVERIDGLSGGRADGRSSDWFYFVNGVEAGVGAAEYEPADGDRIWWDRRDWSTAMRVPAVVGSWPQPFAGGYAGERWAVAVHCRAQPEPCGQVEDRLGEHGVEADRAGPSDDADGRIRVLVGTWTRIGEDPVASLLASGPERSGVFARFSSEGSRVGLALLDARGRTGRTLGEGAGLVAALRPDQGPPTWVVTGTDEAGVAAAAELLGGGLRDLYAVAAEGDGREQPLPLR